MLVSTIIPYHKEKKYLLRCINAIKRQTHEEIEIIVVTKEQHDEIEDETVCCCSDIKDALSKIKGKYLLFVTNTSILAQNAIAEMLAGMKNADLVSAGVGILEGIDYKSYMQQLFVYGKMFKTSLLQELWFDEESSYSEFEFLAKYLTKCNRFFEIPKTLIYETDMESLNSVSANEFHMAAWKKLFELIGTDASNTATGIVSAKENKKIAEYQLRYLEENNGQTFLLMTEYLHPEVQKEIVYVNTGAEAEAEEMLQQMSGDVLAKFIVDKYKEGKLGLKPLIKSLIAWLKYKF